MLKELIAAKIRLLMVQWIERKNQKEWDDLSPIIFEYGTIWHGKPSKLAKEKAELIRMRLYNEAIDVDYKVCDDIKFVEARNDVPMA